MSSTVPSGGTILLELVLEDRATGLFPQARIFDSSGAQVGAVIDLVSAAARPYAYHGTRALPAGRANYFAVFDVYTDVAHTILSDHGAEDEAIRVGEELDARDAVLNAANKDFISAGSVGESLLMAGAQGGVSARIDALTYDTNDRPTKFRVRVFDTAANAASSTPGATGEAGEVLTFEEDATHINAARWQSLLRRRV